MSFTCWRHSFRRAWLVTPRDLINVPGGRFIRTLEKLKGGRFIWSQFFFGGDGLLGRSNNFSPTRKFFRRSENFEKKKKVWSDAIDFVKKSSKSEPSSRFLSRSKFENFACHFWRIQPIVPGFMRICLRFHQISGRSAEFAFFPFSGGPPGTPGPRPPREWKKKKQISLRTFDTN